MVFMLPQREERPGLGELLGGGLGAGLSSGIQMLAQQKLQEMAARGKVAEEQRKQQQVQQKETAAYQQMGMDERQASAMAALPADVKKQVFKQQMLSQLLGGRETPGEPDAAIPGQAVGAETPQISPEDLSTEQIAAISQVDPAVGRVLMSEKKLQVTETREKFKTTKEYRKKINEDFRDYKQTEDRLNRMEKLQEEGDLTKPSTAFLLEKMDLPLGVLSNPESEEFDKLSKDLLKNIRTYFGARINVVEVQNFLKTIPKLTNSPEGRTRIIRNLKLLSKPSHLI